MLASDDAQTDVILAAATAVFGVSLRAFIQTFAWYPQAQNVRRVLDLVWIVALTALVPVLLARYRGDNLAAFGIKTAGLFREPALLIPAFFVVSVTYLLLPGLLTTPQAIFGRAMSPFGVLETVALGFGAFTLITFVSVRARDGYMRSPDVPLKQLVRTGGMLAAAVTIVTGLLRALGPRPTGTAALIALLYGATVVLITVLADRAIPYGMTVTRASIVAPLILVAVSHVFATGGLFRGDLLTGVFLTAIAAGTTLLISSRTHLPNGTIALVPFLLVIHLWPTCLSPLAVMGGFC